MIKTKVVITACTTVEMLSTGCKAIDTILHGGLIRGAGITEISGESGSGKTQLCLQLSLLVQNSEDNGGFDKGLLNVFSHFLMRGNINSVCMYTYFLIFIWVSKLGYQSASTVLALHLVYEVYILLL